MTPRYGIRNTLINSFPVTGNNDRLLQTAQWAFSSGSTLFDIQSINFIHKRFSKWWFVKINKQTTNVVWNLTPKELMGIGYIFRGDNCQNGLPPSEMGFTLKGKNLLLLRASFFFLEWTILSKVLCVQICVIILSISHWCVHACVSLCVCVLLCIQSDYSEQKKRSCDEIGNCNKKQKTKKTVKCDFFANIEL